MQAVRFPAFGDPKSGSSSFIYLKVFVFYMKLWNILWTDHGFLSYLPVVTFEQCLEHFPVLVSSSFGRQYWDRPSPWLSYVGRHWPHFHKDCLPECSLDLVRDKVKLLFISESFDYLLLLVAYSVANSQFWIEQSFKKAWLWKIL